MLKWIKEKWNSFQDWVSSWFPGLKTKAVVVLGALGNLAAVITEYMAGLPSLTQYVTERNLLIANVVLFTMAFWFRGLTNRES